MAATVLLVDDELDTLHVLEMTLRSSGYIVMKTDRGEKALALMAREPVDLAFIDYRMPEMDGLELLRRLQKDYPDLPVIMLTATESIQLAVQAIKAGAYDYLAKPFNYHQIQIVAEKALGQRAEAGKHPAAQRTAENLSVRKPGGPVRGHAGGIPQNRESRRSGSQRAHSGGKRHGQGTDCAGHSL